MNRIVRFLLSAVAIIACIGGAQAQEVPQVQDSRPSLTEFIDTHPVCLQKKVIFEGCYLNLVGDYDYLFVQLNVLHPALQMRLLMQGLTLYIDPTGKKKEKYALVFPGAATVKDQLTPPDEAKAPEEGNSEGETEEFARPDIMPLIKALAAEGVTLDIDGRTETIDKSQATISLNTDEGVLSFTALLPTVRLLAEKKLVDQWTVGIYSEGGNQPSGPGGGPGGGFGGPMNGPSNRPRQSRQQPTDEGKLQKMMAKDISEWTSFSLSEVGSLNEK